MFGSIFTALVAAATVQAHILISYPGSRGNNLITNSSHPYGMQWEYPCTFPPATSTTHSPMWPQPRSPCLVPVFKKQGHPANEIQAAASPPRKTEPTGPRPAAPSPSSPAGSRATPRRCYT